MSEITNYDGLMCTSLMAVLALSASMAAGVLYLMRRDKRNQVPSEVIVGEYTSEYSAFYNQSDP